MKTEHEQIMEAIDSLTEEQHKDRRYPNVPLPEGYVWTRNCLSGQWGVIDESSKHVPYLDPAYETYHCI